MISKSSIKKFMECPKKFWYSTNTTNHINNLHIENGLDVGLKARSVYEKGFLIEHKKQEPYDLFVKKLEQETIKNVQKNVLFEATITKDLFYCKIDILRKNEDFWELIEVKSGTSIKDEYLLDIAIQKAIVSNNIDFKINKFFLWTINPKRTNNNDFFVETDVSEQIKKFDSYVLNNFQEIKKVLNYPDMPIKELDSNCFKYECPYIKNCTKQFESKPSILDLPIKNITFDLLKKNITEISTETLPFLEPHYDSHILKSIIDDKPYIDKKNLSEMFDSLEYPYIFLDFETISYIENLYTNVGPYDPIPFQFSIFIDNYNEFSDLGFLAKSLDDPREEFIQNLISKIPSSGSIIVYNASFEKRILSLLKNEYPKYAESLETISNRIVDLYPIIKKHVYYPKFKKSYSLKSITPAILGNDHSYDNVEIKNGQMAQLYFKRMLNEVNIDKRIEIIKFLEDYCLKDTKSLCLIIHELKKIIKS